MNNTDQFKAELNQRYEYYISGGRMISSAEADKQVGKIFTIRQRVTGYTYVYDPAALAEYEYALTWYKERSETAAENFVIEVKKETSYMLKSFA